MKFVIWYEIWISNTTCGLWKHYYTFYRGKEALELDELNNVGRVVQSLIQLTQRKCRFQNNFIHFSPMFCIFFFYKK